MAFGHRPCAKTYCLLPPETLSLPNMRAPKTAFGRWGIHSLMRVLNRYRKPLVCCKPLVYWKSPQWVCCNRPVCITMYLFTDDHCFWYEERCILHGLQTCNDQNSCRPYLIQLEWLGCCMCLLAPADLLAGDVALFSHKNSTETRAV